MIEILNAIYAATGLKPIPIETTKAETCIVYNYYSTANYTYKFELRIMDSTFKGAQALAAKVRDALEDFGDASKVSSVSSIVQNGGGTMKDYNNNMIQSLLYFDVIIKE